MKRMRYTNEFKFEAVKKITEPGYDVAEVAKNLSVSTKSLYKWRREMFLLKLSADVVALKKEVTRGEFKHIMKLKLPSALVLSILFVNPSYAADIYRIDREHTFVSFSYSHQNYSIQTSRFDNVSGKIVLDEAAGTGVIDMEIDMKSVSTGSSVFNKRIQENDFFDTETFPIATFKSEKITFAKDGISSVQGNLTIKGHTKPVSIDVKNFYCSRSLLTLAYTCGANAVTQVNRSDFDMGKYVPFVGDEITIGIAIEASKE